MRPTACVNGGTLSTLTRDGAAVSVATQVIKGVSYAFFPALAGSYAATYVVDTTVHVTDSTAAPFAARSIVGPVTVSDAGGGEVILTPGLAANGPVCRRRHLPVPRDRRRRGGDLEHRLLHRARRRTPPSCWPSAPVTPPTPDATWSAFTTICASGGPIGTTGRQAQSRVVLVGSADTQSTPALGQVDISYWTP
jgi:hypothetical protein